MLGLNFSDFSWWLWLLTGVGAFIAVIEVMCVSCRRKYEAMKVLLSVRLDSLRSSASLSDFDILSWGRQEANMAPSVD